MPYMNGLYGNPSSVHRYGRLARNALEQARVQVAQLVGAQPRQVIFTSGGTEANNFALRGVLCRLSPASFAVSSIEHASILAPARLMAKQGWQLDELRVNCDGRLLTSALLSALTDATKFVSIMSANNETGVIQDIGGLVAAAKADKPELIFHSDACQLAGKAALNFAQLDLDLMSISSHKIYGPQGVGALVVKSRVDLAPLIVGGGQERQQRSGTENLACLVGFGMAAEVAGEKIRLRAEHCYALKKQLIERLQSLPGVSIFSQHENSLANTLMFALRGIEGETLLMQLDKKGFAVSSGSACDSGSSEPSHVLLAMSVEPEIAKSAIRVSFGEQNTREEVSQFIDALTDIRQQFT